MALQADALVVGYGGKGFLPALDLRIERGQRWAVFGHNGGGKTSLIRTLLGLQPEVAGSVTRPSTRVGYVPQRSSIDLAVPQRVVDIVRAGCEHDLSFLSPRFLRAQRPRVERVMQETNIASLARQPFALLSEGQKQRVLLARALLSDPDILVLDEPTSAMDMSAERAAFELLDKLQRERGFATLVVTHHVALVVDRATHGILLDKDAGIALAGDLDTVTSHAAFIERYGFLAGSPIATAIRGALPDDVA